MKNWPVLLLKILKKRDLKYHLQTMKRNATYLSVATFDELQLAVSKHIETSTAMELSLPNEFTLGADESTSMSETPELSIFIKYVNSVTNTLCERFLCLISLGSSKSARALHEAIVKVFSDQILKIKNIFFNAFDGTNTMSGSILKVCFRKISIAGGITLFLCLFN